MVEKFDAGWYGGRFLITKEDKERGMFQQMSLDEKQVLEVKAAIGGLKATQGGRR